MPWAYVRYRIAQHWNVPPWIVDAVREHAPGEIDEVLAIWKLEDEADRRRAKRRG